MDSHLTTQKDATVAHPKSLENSVELDPSKFMIHRDLSWLEFNERVLEESLRPDNPLLERLKFLGISATNLDEFFMIRFSSVARAVHTLAKSGDEASKNAAEELQLKILQKVKAFQKKQEQALTKITEILATVGTTVVTELGKNLGEEMLALVRKEFEEKIFPHLPTPIPFKWKSLLDLENLQMAVLIGNKEIVVVPKTLPQAIFFRGKDKRGYVFFLDQALCHFLEGRVPGESCRVIRVCRDADFSVDLEEEDPESIPDIVRSTVRSRDRGRIHRVQTLGKFKAEWRTELAKNLGCIEEQCFESAITSNLAGLRKITRHLQQHHRKEKSFEHPKLKKRIPPKIQKRSEIFEALKKSDLLLHHPYDSFDGFVKWVECAVNDPLVIEIQMTVYRTDATSPVIDLLKLAAKTKKVSVLIELRARFDELNNLRLTEDLKAAGVRVGFGFGKLKLHAKIALVTRKENDSLFYYTHLSTGNYNSATARQYEDFAILTANQDLGHDAKTFLEAVWEERIPTHFKSLVSAPTGLHRRMLSLIKQETEAARQGKSAHIVAKVNALVDQAIIESLYIASQAGVKVDLIVRGACSLIPEVKGLSENIRVISIVDRFLEHSRIYYFKNASAIYLSSADWMTRNFFSRLEVAFPVLDKQLFSFIQDIVLPAYLADSERAHRLNSKGVWQPAKPKSEMPLPQQTGAMRAQFYFMGLAERHYAGTPLSKRN